MTGGGVSERIPGLALAAGMLALFVAIPYASFTSDVANYGLMGWDIINRGYLPTLAYGQSYLFSPTPYAFALVRMAAPEWIGDAVAMKLAGALFSIPGMLLIFESLIMAQRQSNKPVMGPVILFALVMASSDAYIFDISLNSSNEMSLFLTGALLYIAGRMDFRIESSLTPGRLSWALLGVVTIFMQFGRPMLLTFAVPALLGLLAKTRNVNGWGATARALAIFAAGVAIGYTPMLAHLLFRADNWPYLWFLPLEIGGGLGLENAIGVLVHVILPRLLTMLWDEYPVRYVITALWLASISWITILALTRGGKRAFIVTDWAWIIGQGSSILIMAAIPALSGDTGSRRYCLHLLPAATWLFVRFAFPLGKAGWVSIALALAMVVSSMQGWKDQISYEMAQNRLTAKTVEEALPELESMDAVILTDYWDAYLLSFFSRERVVAEAFPWQIVRRYGYFTKERMARRTVWLVCDGYAHNTLNILSENLGPEAVELMGRKDISNKIVGRSCEAWELEDRAAPANLMEKFQPRFFTSAYPPG